MTTEINNLSPQSIRNPGLRQLNVPSAASRLSPAASRSTDNIVRMDVIKRQAVASNSSTQAGFINQQPTDKQRSSLADSVQELSRAVQSISRSLEFRVDDNSGKTVITVRDGDTKKIIRQIPSEQVLKISARLQELQQNIGDSPSEITGILFTSKI